MSTRIARLKPCLVPSCTALVPTKGNRKRCDPCQIEKWRRDDAAQRARRGQLEPFQESPEAIDRRFAAALAEIKRRPRGKPEIRWTSALAGLYGTGL